MLQILTIGGSDTLAGGGIQADLKTFNQFHTFGLSALTSIATVSPQHEFNINTLTGAQLQQQLDAINYFSQLDAIKIGLIPSIEQLEVVVSFLKQQAHLPIIIDPVLIFKEGHQQLTQPYLTYLKKALLPLATVITPNLKEAALLANQSEINHKDQMLTAAKTIQELGVPNVIIKGGQRLKSNLAVDLILKKTRHAWLTSPLIETIAIDGAGCTFSAAICAQLANPEISLATATKVAKDFVYQGILNGLTLNDGLGNVTQLADLPIKKEIFYE